MLERFTLTATMTDGRKVSLPGDYPSQAAAERGARVYIRDYSDPCGLGLEVESVEITRRRHPQQQAA